MLTTNPYLVYKNQDIETASPRELVAKLLNTATISLRRAAIAIREKRLESASNDFLKAENIICALDGSLDMSYPISTQFHQIYGHILNGLARANIQKDLEAAEQFAGVISDLRDTWIEAEGRAGGESAARGAV